MTRSLPGITAVFLLLLIPSLVHAWCNNCGSRGCCRCPGEAQCLGSFSTCEEACGLVRRPSPMEQAIMEREREQAMEARRLQNESVIKDDWDAKESRRRSQDRQSFVNERNQAGAALKDAVSDASLKGSASSSPEQSKQVTAWKQLHCAASIAGHALAALQTKGDYDEFGTLSTEALKALDGQRPGVECGNAPPFPDLRGKTVDMDRVKGTERQVLERAAAIADRMKQRQASPRPSQAAIPAGSETPDERLRRVQRELNVINSRPTGRTQREIDQQEKDRRELARLVLVNNGLVNGVFTSVSVDTREGTSSRPRRRREPPPPPSTNP